VGVAGGFWQAVGFELQPPPPPLEPHAAKAEARKSPKAARQKRLARGDFMRYKYNLKRFR
jgi:hypothetical protein